MQRKAEAKARTNCPRVRQILEPSKVSDQGHPAVIPNLRTDTTLDEDYIYIYIYTMWFSHRIAKLGIKIT